VRTNATTKNETSGVLFTGGNISEAMASAEPTARARAPVRKTGVNERFVASSSGRNGRRNMLGVNPKYP
jgi:hypothetical protein